MQLLAFRLYLPLPLCPYGHATRTLNLKYAYGTLRARGSALCAYTNYKFKIKNPHKSIMLLANE
jgi:hypothetical protein